MPDHFHGIIFIKEEMDISLGQVIAGFMKGCTKVYHTMIESAVMPTTEQRLGTVGVSAYLPTMPTLPPIHLPTLPPLWEKGYHDRPLWRNGQLQQMIDYVQDNPRRL